MKYVNEFEQMHDHMGITIETEDKFLDKKLNGHICYKGGGNKTTQTSAIPEWLRPHVEGYVKKAVGAESRGDLSKVAGLTSDQMKAADLARGAAGQQGELARRGAIAQQEALSGTGLFGAQDLSGARADFLAQAREQGDTAAGQIGAGAAARGTLGSARSRMAQEKARESARLGAADRFLGLQQQDLAARRAAQQGAVGQTAGLQSALGQEAKTYGNVGQQIQQQRQKEADATWQGLQRLGSAFGVGAQTATDKTQKQGGGK